MSFVHGGNVYEIASLLGCAPEVILDFSASINPLGPPPGLMQELERHFNRIQYYPDIHARDILNAVSEYHGFPSSRVIVGNGSTELIYWLPRVLGIKRAAIVLPTFSEYLKAFKLHGVQLRKVFCSAENGFQPTTEQLDRVCDAFTPDAILFTNPASPAGTTLPPTVREWVHDRSRSGKTLCIVDEVFVDFCEEESFKGLVGESVNLILIRSMTKFYGIPGLRLGYLLAPDEIVEQCRRSLPPWGVSTFAQIGGIYCLGQEEYRKRTLHLIERERRDLQLKLSGITGFHVFKGRANYLLVQMEERLPPADALQEELLKSHRILIRDCGSFEGLSRHFVRLAVRLPEQNRFLLEAITRWPALQ